MCLKKRRVIKFSIRYGGLSTRKCSSVPLVLYTQMPVFPNHYTDSVHIQFCDLPSQSTTLWLWCETFNHPGMLYATDTQSCQPIFQLRCKPFVAYPMRVLPSFFHIWKKGNYSTLFHFDILNIILLYFSKTLDKKICIVCETVYFCIHPCWGPRVLSHHMLASIKDW